MKHSGEADHGLRMSETKRLASLIMHKHYCEHDVEGIIALLSLQVTWLGTGEEEFVAGRDACVERFMQFKGKVPPCRISGEEYEAASPAEDLYVVMGRMWITADPASGLLFKVHQRVTFVFQDSDEGLLCAHIHCSNPYDEMLPGKVFPEKIGRMSYRYVQERLERLEEKTRQQSRQMEVIMSSIAGGLKISEDNDTYSYLFVSREAAALFGYTVEEFMEAAGGSALGNIYPPDIERVRAEYEAARNSSQIYSIRYRMRCKDGSLKWIIDSGKRAKDADGKSVVNSLYLDVTRSEEDAEQLREQTRLLASIYDTVPCGIIRFLRAEDGGYRLISLNKAAVWLMGYERMEDGLNDWHEGVLGNVLEEDRIALQETYRNLNGVGDRQDREYRVRWKDGSIHWMDGTNMIVGITADGESIIQRTAVDITQRKALQRRLDREQDMYRVAMEASFAVMFEYLMDTDTFISYEPKPGRGVFRQEMKEYSKTLLERQIVHPDDVPMVIDNICNGRTEVFEVRCALPDGEPGEYIWHRVNSRLMIEDGRPSRVVGAFHNIHSMKSELSENSERLHMNQSALQAISGVYVSIFYVDLQKDSYYAVRMPEAGKNDSISRAGSFSGQLYDYILQKVDPSNLERVKKICDREWLLRELSGENEHIEVEFKQIQRDLWLRAEVHRLAAEEQRPDTVILAFRNISAEKQSELKYYEEEKRAKAALEEAYASVNRANQAKSEFLSRMSHDIRTPMNAIMGMAAIAENHLKDVDKVADCLSKINLSGRHLLELINEVLDMSKIESGNISLSEDKFSLDEMMDEIYQIIRPSVESKGQSFHIYREDMRHKVVYADVVRMKQILINLLSNAVKYTDEGGHINVYMEEKLSSESGVGCFEFIVEDDGIGMPPEFLDKLFLPFERAEDSRVSKIQGTGLGMSITRNLVQMMNGTIQVESQLDQGSRFTVTIYLKLVQDQEDPHGGVTGGSRRIQATFAPGTRILLVEDNSLNQEIAKELLSLSGLEVVCADDGQEAVDRFLADPPGTYDLILMDIQMPVLDGYGATRAIRRLGMTKERPDAETIPIIALTANAFADDAYQAKKAGMDGHVTKPLEISKLLEVIHQWVDPGSASL